MAARLYERGPSADELAVWGLTEADVVNNDVVDIWPENWLPYQIFVSLSTSWNVGPGGPVGLQWQAVPVWLDLFKVKSKKRYEVAQALRIMEAAALKAMSEDR